MTELPPLHWHGLRDWLEERQVVPAPLGLGSSSWAWDRPHQPPALISEDHAGQLVGLSEDSMRDIRLSWFGHLREETLRDLERAGYFAAQEARS